jgi:Uma2 family endonuclease
MTAELVPYITEEEYLAGEPRSAVKHEYFDGRVWAMAGATDSHEMVSGNFFLALGNHLRGKGCRVYKSDMKVRLTLAGKPLFYYPDVMVACDPDEKHPLYRERPRLIVEVLSEDEDKDLVEKLLAYQRIASLEEYVVASQRAEAPMVKIFRRAEGWEPGEEHTGTNAEFELRSVGLKLRMADLFAS